MAADDPQTRLRFPPDLKVKLEEQAKINNRSLNAEVVSRLELTFLSENFAAIPPKVNIATTFRRVSDAIAKASERFPDDCNFDIDIYFNVEPKKE